MEPNQTSNSPTPTFSVDAVIDRINRRYTGMIVSLVNENAQLVAANDALKDRLAEVENELVARRELDEQQVPYDTRATKESSGG